MKLLSQNYPDVWGTRRAGRDGDLRNKLRGV